MNKIIHGDCIEELKKISDNSVDLVLTDPPYNIGWKYSDKINDNKKDYSEWCLEWAKLSISKLKENGIIAIINYPENNNILYTDLIREGYNFVQELIWYYPTNIGHSKNKYTRNFRTIIIFSKSEKYTFNPIKQSYKNPKDKRIIQRIKEGHKGTNHYTTFEYNLCKNVSKDKKNNGINQLPKELVEMLIKTYTNEGDYICDPFVGNGTVINIAEELNRNSLGIDINEYKT
jgi:site-specific DNA-methyltransferase (adenine-specific)|tara:strand:+ start:310 stop:1002 length:693 start_codon:yes stop_codon:yes gene_type:complete